MADETERMQNSIHDVVEMQEELDSHDQIDQLVDFENVATASNLLRCDLTEFINASDSPQSSAEEAYDGSSEAGTDSAESLKVIIASPVKKPCVPASWRKTFQEMPKLRLAQIAEKTVISHVVSSDENELLLQEPGGASRTLQPVSDSVSTSPPQEEPNTSKPVISENHAVQTKAAELNDVKEIVITQEERTIEANVPLAEDEDHRPVEKACLFPVSNRSAPMINTTILKFANLPFEITVDELLDWLGEDAKNATPDSAHQIVSVHILCKRFSGKTTWPAYVELTSYDAAKKVKRENWGTLLKGREIKIDFCSRRAMLSDIFPTWASTFLSQREGIPIVSNHELSGLIELCKLRSAYAKTAPERPYMNVLTIAAKYPWRSRDLLDESSEEQAQVLQTVREAHKLLKQYGKRVPKHAELCELFTTFLEGHGGVCGSLRPIPVDPSCFPPRQSQHVQQGDFVSAIIGRQSSTAVEIEAATPPGAFRGGFAEEASAASRRHALVEALLRAQKASQEADEAVQIYITPEASPEKILPASLTAAPMKKGGILHVKEHEMKTPLNANSLAEVKRYNEAYEMQMRLEQIRRARELHQQTKTKAGGSTASKCVAAPLGKTISTMSMDSQISVKSGNTTRSSPIVIEKTGKLESLFTPPPKFRLFSPAPPSATAHNETVAANDDGESAYKRDFGMTREEIGKILQERAQRDQLGAKEKS